MLLWMVGASCSLLAASNTFHEVFYKLAEAVRNCLFCNISEFPSHPSGGVNTPNFRTTPPASYLDDPLISIITFTKYEQYLVYIMFIVDSDGGYLFIEFCIKIRQFCMKFRYLILRKIIKLLPPDVRF